MKSLTHPKVFMKSMSIILLLVEMAAKVLAHIGKFILLQLMLPSTQKLVLDHLDTCKLLLITPDKLKV